MITRDDITDIQTYATTVPNALWHLAYLSTQADRLFDVTLPNGIHVAEDTDGWHAWKDGSEITRDYAGYVSIEIAIRMKLGE